MLASEERLCFQPSLSVFSSRSLESILSEGGFSTKIHYRIEGSGKPRTIRLTAGQLHEATELEPLFNGTLEQLNGLNQDVRKYDRRE